MNRVDPDFLREPHNAGDVQVRPNRFARLADLIRFVCLKRCNGEAVFVGINCDGAYAQLVRRPEHADGDFASVGDEDFVEGRDCCASRHA